MRCDLGRVSSSPHTSFSSFSFVRLVCLIWNLFPEGCLASCVGLGHWHLSSPLLEEWLEAFVSFLTPHFRTHEQGYRGPPAVHQGTGRAVTQHWPGRVCHLLFTARAGRWKEVLTLNGCFTALITKGPLKWKLWPYGEEPRACDEFSWHQMWVTGMKSLKGWRLCLECVGMCACVVVRSSARTRSSTPEKPHLFVSAPSHRSLSVANVQSHLSSTKLPKTIKTQWPPVPANCKTVPKGAW